MIKIGKIKQRAALAFEWYKAGDFKGFLKELIDCTDKSVHYQSHRDIMDDEVDKQLKKL